jgi:VIT family
MDGELHRSERIGWLRAATLGANDGLISTSSLVVGVASAEPTQAAVLLAAVAGLVAGPSPWQRASTFRSAPKRIPSGLISPRSAMNLLPRRRPSEPSWRGSTWAEASAANSRSKSRIN